MNLVEDALKKECVFRDKHFYHKRTNQKIAAIMPVFCLGSLIDFEDIKNFRNKFSIPMVLDSAAALGSTYEDMGLGASSADVSVLSFNGNKTFTTGGGGAVLTNNEVLYEKINHISTTARVGKDYLHDEVGFNYRMTNLQAAVGIAQLDRFKEFVEKKRYIQNYYKDNILLTDISYKQSDTKKIKNVRWLSHIYLSKVSKIQPKDVFLALEKSKIESRTFWIPMHKQLPYQKSLANLDGTAEEIYTNLIILPSSTNLDSDKLERVTTSLNSLSN